MSLEIKEPDLFSVIVLHYNQEKWIKTALDSVFAQDYSNIELIIADDCTPGLRSDVICAYVEQNKGHNISRTIYQFNQENLGTVKNVNQAVKAAHGKYVLFFAADDCLWDSHTISNYAKSLDSLPDDLYVASSQCYMMDVKLEEVFGPFVNVPIALQLNQDTAQEQYRKMAFSCLYAMGATAMKASIWQKYGYFDESYKIIEDWSFFLHLTRSGTKITFFSFGGLKHRDGGVSHYNTAFNQMHIPPHVLDYKDDSLTIQEREILPFLPAFSSLEQEILLNKYEAEREAFKIHSAGRKRIRRIDLIRKNKKLYLKRGLRSLITKSPIYRKALMKGLLGLIGTLLLMYVAIIIGNLASGTVSAALPGIVYLQVGIWLVVGLLVLLAILYLLMFGLSLSYFLWKQKIALFSSEK